MSRQVRINRSRGLILHMARKTRPEGPTSYIDERERLAILSRMAERDLNKRQLARECDVSPAAITLLLSKPISDDESQRACRFLGKLQKALGLELTTRRPSVLPRGVDRRIDRIVDVLKEEPELLETWLRMGELRAKPR